MNITASRYARAVHELETADDLKLHMAGTLANLMIFARNTAPVRTPEFWQAAIDAFCEEMEIKQVEGPMGDLMWTHIDNEDA